VPLAKTVSANFEPWSPPQLDISSPSENGTYRSNVPLAFTLTLSGYGPYPENLINLYYSLDGKPDVAIAHGYVNGIVVTEWISGVNNGEHTLVIHGSTDMGHTFSGNVNFTVDASMPLDNGTPRIFIVSPENETYLGFDCALPLNFSVSKPIAWSLYSLNNAANVTIFDNTTISNYNPGSNNVTVYAVSEAGNVGASETIHFTMINGIWQNKAYLPSPIYPVVSVFSPQNVAYNTSNVPLSLTIDGPISLDASVFNFSSNGLVHFYPKVLWVGYSLDGQNNITLLGNTTLTSLPAGAHNITVYAKDTYGNIGSSQTIFFTTTTEPFPTITFFAVSIPVAIIVVAGLLVYFKKRKH
jgi:hypothetical protein